MIGFNGGLIGKDRTVSILGAVGVRTPNEQVRYRSASNWPFIVDGTIEGPFELPLQAVGFPSGVYYYKPAGYTGAAFEAYTDCTTEGGPWVLTWVVTNNNGDGTDWWDGDSSMGTGPGTNHFTSISTLGSTNSGSNKANAKNPFFDYYAFTNMMIVENHAGTLGTKRYALTTNSSFRSLFSVAESTSNNIVSSVLGSTGSFTTFNTNALHVNVGLFSTLSGDGGRLVAALPSLEASGGISCRVDGSRGYSWKGNLTRSDANRSYGLDGTTTDHTVWIYVK